MNKRLTPRHIIMRSRNKKTKSISKAEEYETTPEDKKRRKQIPENELGTLGQELTDNSPSRFNRYLLAIKHGSSNKVNRLAGRFVGKLKENSMILVVIVFLVSIWASGFLAHSGQSFYSLLAVVLGFVVLVIGSYRKVK